MSNRNSAAITAHPAPIPNIIPRCKIEIGLIISNAEIPRIVDKIKPKAITPYRVFVDILNFDFVFNLLEIFKAVSETMFKGQIQEQKIRPKSNP